MVALRRQMQMNMELSRFSPRTQKCYLDRIAAFANHFFRCPKKMGEAEIRTFLHYLITERKLSQGFVSQTYSALKFLHEITLEREWNLDKIPCFKQQKKLPIVLSQEEVYDLLGTIANLKHHVIMTTIYSAGLRLSEAAC